MTEPQPVSAGLCAGIDVGTNSVKMVIADLRDGAATRVYETSVVTRLGEGLHAHAYRLREAAMRRTLDALAEMVDAAHAHGVTRIAAVGTSALRDAVNREEFLHRVHERCGLILEVIVGEEEARLSFLAVRRDPLWRDVGRLWVIDIGGGSTEIIVGEPGGDEVEARVSIDLGAVRLTERCLRSDPPSVTQLMAANEVTAEALRAAKLAPMQEPFVLVGVGGTMTNLATMDCGSRAEPEAIHGYVLRADRLEAQIAVLAARTIEGRKEIVGLDPRRADIILGGAIVLAQALAQLGATAIQVSARGLRWGLLYDRCQDLQGL
jgi:exopolyphosphatase/guanosine-5'-triphosphate,3'-diphosphate pyrophosphatase